MPPPLALVDCNNSYASCERMFQPEVRGQAIVVLETFLKLNCRGLILPRW